MQRLTTMSLGVALLFGPRMPSTTTLIVSVGDAGTGAFIADADVTLPAMRRSARTRWDGEARFASLTSGRYRVQVRAIGYAPGDIEVQLTGDSMGVHFQLERASVALDTMRIVDRSTEIRMAEFESRRRMGIGRFLTDSMIREDRSQSLQWLLATRFPGIKVREHGIESMQPSGLSGDNSCPVLIYMDGHKITDVDREPMKLPTSGAGGGRGGSIVAPSGGSKRREITPLDVIRPDSIAGIELYSRTTAPVQYKPLGNYCKVILIWTRR